MNIQELTSGLAQSVRSSRPEASIEAMREAKKGLLDFTAASFAGRNDSGVEKLLNLIEGEGGVPIAPLIGQGKRHHLRSRRC